MPDRPCPQPMSISNRVSRSQLRICPECRWPEPGQFWPSRHDHDPEVGACYACDNPCSRCDGSDQ